MLILLLAVPALLLGLCVIAALVLSGRHDALAERHLLEQPAATPAPVPLMVRSRPVEDRGGDFVARHRQSLG